MSLLTRSFRKYTLERKTGTQGNKAWTVQSGSHYKGFIQPISSREMFKFSQSGEDSTHRLYTIVKADIQKGDKVTDRNGDEYLVTSARQSDGIAGFNKHKEILMKVFN